MSNRLVVIVPRESGRTLQGAAGLQSAGQFLGDPATVPAGTYAKKRWLRAGIWESVKNRVVPTLDVRAALAAIEAGRADVGIVYKTDAATSQRVRIAYEVPPDAMPPIIYVAAVIASSKNPAAAAFLQYLTGRLVTPRSPSTASFSRRECPNRPIYRSWRSRSALLSPRRWSSYLWAPPLLGLSRDGKGAAR